MTSTASPPPFVRTSSPRERAVGLRLRRVLAALELVSTAPTQRLGGGCPAGGDGQPGSPHAPHEHVLWRLRAADVRLRRALDAAETEGDTDARERLQRLAGIRYVEMREEIASDAEAELARLTGRNGRAPAPRVAELDEPGALGDLVCKDGEGWSPKEVALRFRVTPTMVRRFRVERDRDPDTGKLVEGAAPDAGLAERAAALAEQGMPQRKIAMALKVSQPTVCRLLACRAA